CSRFIVPYFSVLVHASCPATATTEIYTLSLHDALPISQTKEMSDFYDATVAAGADPKLAANWLMGEVNAYLNSKQVELSDTGLTDRKSTRLNSSHVSISYAVFCLKKKIKNR